MTITEYTFCQDRPVRVDAADARVYAWGSGVICCDACVSVVTARESWWARYNVTRLSRTPDNDPWYVR